jgi:hypothetical protein
MCCADHFELKENKMVANQHLATFDFPWLLARIFLQIRKTIIHPSRDSCLSLSSSQTGVQASHALVVLPINGDQLGQLGQVSGVV